MVIDAGLVPESFGVINGDSYLSLDLAAVEAAYGGRLPGPDDGDAQPRPVGASNAVFQDGRVVAYDKSRPARWRARMEWIDYGFSILTPAAVTDRVAPGRGPTSLTSCAT